MLTSYSQCIDAVYSRSARYVKPESCKNGTGVEAMPFSGEAANRNANESTPNGQPQGGSGGSGGHSPSPTGNAAPLQTAAVWGVLGAAVAGGVALL